MVQISKLSSPIQQIQKLQERTDPTFDNKNVATFEETVKKFIEDVNEAQRYAGETVDRFMTGEIKDIHDVMIAVEKAGTSFELIMEIRNRMIEAYHEIMRMQV